MTIIRQLFNEVSKCIKRLHPFFADLYAAPTIIAVWLASRIIAAAHHEMPSAIQRVCRLAIRCSTLFGTETTTRYCAARMQIKAECVRGITTVTTAKPSYMMPCMANGAKRDKSAESLTRYVFSLFGKGDILRLHKKFTFLVPNPGTC